jgi:hypothetical protein
MDGYFYPNLFGRLLFFIWPLIIFWFFKKYTIKQAIFLATFISSILLPSLYVFDLPLIPPLDKNSLTSLTLIVLLFIKKQKNPIHKPGLWNKFFIGYLLVMVISSLLNSDALVTGEVHLPGSTPYDAFSNIVLFLLAFIPFFFGRNFFNNLQDTEYMYKTMVIVALIYTIPMLYEIRFSPQLHTMIYGYFPGDFIQQMRGDGFRPVVLIGHGLALAFWFATCVIAAIALYKNKVKVTKMFGLKAIIYMVVILILCKTVSVVIYLIFATALIFLLKLNKQITFSIVIALGVMVYPFNAASQFVKNGDMLSFVESYSKDRANSLGTRFYNEERLMKRALERPFFGWSGWGRNRIYQNGKDVTITDGRWIIEFGTNGAVGFAFYYLILLYPLFLALKYFKYIKDEKHRVYFASLAIILAVGIFDSVPNTGMMSVHLLLAGALLGQAELLKSRQLQLQREGMRLP